MTDTALAEILATLDLVLFEQMPEGVFLRLGPPPPRWFSRLFLDASRNEPITIAQVMPFLEPFLVDAADLWRRGGDHRLRSEPFMMTDPSGGEVALVASAVSVRNRRFLIIEMPYDFEERRRALQSAREHVLAHEEHIRRTGALSSPVSAVRRLADQLAHSGLTAEQQQLAHGIVEQLARLSESIDALAPLPKGVTRRHPR